MAAKVNSLFVSCILMLFMQQLMLCRGYKRARPAVADLEMLIANDQSGLPSSESGARGYENLVNLADTLKRLQEMDKYITHQARPRYGRSVPESVPASPVSDNTADISLIPDMRLPLFRRRRSLF